MKKLKRSFSLIVALMMLAALLVVPSATASDITSVTVAGVNAGDPIVFPANNEYTVNVGALVNVEPDPIGDWTAPVVVTTPTGFHTRYWVGTTAPAAAAVFLEAMPNVPVGSRLVIELWRDVQPAVTEVIAPGCTEGCEAGNVSADCDDCRAAADEVPAAAFMTGTPEAPVHRTIIVAAAPAAAFDINLDIANERLAGVPFVSGELGYPGFRALDLATGQALWVQFTRDGATSRPNWVSVAPPFNVARQLNRAGTLRATIAPAGARPARDLVVPDVNTWAIADRGARADRPTIAAAAGTWVDFNDDTILTPAVPCPSAPAACECTAGCPEADAVLGENFVDRFGTGVGVRIAGITNAMEFKISTDDDWTPGAAAPDIFPVGWTQQELWVRVAAAPGRAASDRVLCATCEAATPTPATCADDACEPAVTAAAYAAGGATQRLRIPAVGRPPNPRVDFVRGTVRFNANWEFMNDDGNWVRWTRETATMTVTPADFEGDDAFMKFRVAVPANYRRPPSATVELFLDYNSADVKPVINGFENTRDIAVAVENMAVIRNRLVPAGGRFMIENQTIPAPANNRWRRGAPRFDRQGVLALTNVRMAGERNLRLFPGSPVEIAATGFERPEVAADPVALTIAAGTGLSADTEIEGLSIILPVGTTSAAIAEINWAGIPAVEEDLCSDCEDTFDLDCIEGCVEAADAVPQDAVVLTTVPVEAAATATFSWNAGNNRLTISFDDCEDGEWRATEFIVQVSVAEEPDPTPTADP